MSKFFTPVFFVVLSCFILPFQVFAQPVGCMQTNQKIKLEPLTPAEKAMIVASNERSDTIDILNYNITLEVINFSQGIINGNCKVTFSPKMDNINYLALDLLDLTVDSVHFNGQPVSYVHDGLLLEIFYPSPLNTTDTADVTVFYNGPPTRDPSWGGFDFNNGYAYNLGIGLTSNPYNFGRSWFPCFDNFVERSTYDFNILSSAGRKAYCVGTFLEEVPVSGDTIMRRYRLDQPIPTYLAGVAVSNYSQVDINHEGFYGDIHFQLVAKTNDTLNMVTTFASLGEAVDAIEYWYGPYVWDRVGYVTTVQGAMEHPGNIAYPESVGLDGDDFAHKRLMSHELVHCWFGDVVTLSSPADMWFKEGNAEYGAHLFTEYFLGQDQFIDQVKDNFLEEVLKRANFDDDGFQPLSGIPYEHTYGTHTYYKGASMIHNLRGYLGDSLFRVGQRSVLENFAYGSVDAAQYRDQLTTATGVDLTSFFDDWIYAPGFAAYEIDSLDVEQNGSEYETTVYIQQKLRAAPHFHTNTPIEITFMDDNWNRYVESIMVSDEFTTAQVTLPFEPTVYFLNEGERLNIAMMANNVHVNAPMNRYLGYADMQVTISSVVDSAFLRAEHYWVAPDEIGDNPFNATISSTHYWEIDGINLDGVQGIANIKYSGITQPHLDMDLAGTTEDSIILVYREDAYHPWVEHPDYSILNINPNDGTGNVVFTGLKKGQYAFANGSLPMVSTTNIFDYQQLKLYPNPTSEKLYIDGELEITRDLKYRISDVLGKLIAYDNLDDMRQQIDVSRLENGIYIFQIIADDGTPIGTEQFEIIR